MKLLRHCVSIVLAPILALAPLPGQTPETPASTGNSASFEALQLRLVENGNGSAVAGSKTPRSFVLEVTDSKGSPVSDAAIVLRLPDTDPTGTFADGSHAAIAYTDQTGRASINVVQWAPTQGIVAIRATATKGTAHAGILIQETLTGAAQAPAPTLPGQTAPGGALPPAVSELPQPSPPHVEIEPLSKKIAPGQLATPPSSTPLRGEAGTEPSVSVTSAAPGESRHSGKTKWIILAAIAAAAGGAGVAMMGKKSGSSTSTAPGISIGPPTVSVGHP